MINIFCNSTLVTQTKGKELHNLRKHCRDEVDGLISQANLATIPVNVDESSRYVKYTAKPQQGFKVVEKSLLKQFHPTYNYKLHKKVLS